MCDDEGPNQAVPAGREARSGLVPAAAAGARGLLDAGGAAEDALAVPEVAEVGGLRFLFTADLSYHFLSHGNHVDTGEILPFQYYSAL